MTIIVNSPFTGRPVRIREKDVGRAVTDEDGGLFYVLPKADGSGYYGAPTRQGGEKDESRAAEQDERVGGARRIAERREHMVHTPHRRARRSRGRGKLVFLLFVIIAAAAWAVFLGPLKGLLEGSGP